MLFVDIYDIISTVRVIFFSLIFILIILVSPIWAVGMNVNLGTWNLSVDSSNLGPPAEAGQQLDSTYTSTDITTSFEITGAGSTFPWKIYIRRSGGNWSSQFSLEIDRTSNGKGDGTISADPGYIQVKETDSLFFSGTGDRKNMNCLYRLSNVTLLIPPGNYSTTIIFTLTD
ncbi:MAG: hypothetical protein AB9903_31565 [Vulcanimicrobiota bacterium]